MTYREAPAHTRNRAAFDGSVSDRTREDLRAALQAVVDHAVLTQGVDPATVAEVLAQHARDEAAFVADVSHGQL